MFVVGFATEEEIELLKSQGWEVEDATKFKSIVGEAEGSLMLPPEPSPSNTKAVVIFVDASVYDVLRPRYVGQGDVPLDLEYRTGPRIWALEQHPLPVASKSDKGTD